MGGSGVADTHRGALGVAVAEHDLEEGTHDSTGDFASLSLGALGGDLMHEDVADIEAGLIAGEKITKDVIPQAVKIIGVGWGAYGASRALGAVFAIVPLEGFANTLVKCVAGAR